MAVIQPPAYLQGVATPPQYSAEDDRQYLNTMAIVPDPLTPARARAGLLPGPSGWDASIVSQSGMDITISRYRAIVQHDLTAFAGDYRVVSPADETITHDGSSGTLNRIDLIGIQVEDEFYAGSVNQASLVIVKGADSSGTPTAPAEPNNFLLLWEARIDAGATTPVMTDRRRSTAQSGGIWIPFSHETGEDGSYVGMLRARSSPERLEQWNGSSWVTLPRRTDTHARYIAVNPQSFPSPGWTKVRTGTSVATCPHITKLAGEDYRIETPGVYHIEGGARFDSSSSGSRHHVISDNVDDTARYVGQSMNGASAGTHSISSGFVREFASGDLIAQYLWQNSGAPLDTSPTGEVVHLSFTLLAET